MSDEYGPIVAPPESPGEHPDAVFGPIVPAVDPYPTRFYVHYRLTDGEIISTESTNMPSRIEGCGRLEVDAHIMPFGSHRVDVTARAIVPLAAVEKAAPVAGRG